MDNSQSVFMGFWGLSTAIRKLSNGKVIAVLDADEFGVVNGDESDNQLEALANVLRKAADMFDRHRSGII